MYFWVVSACGDALFQHRIGGTTVEDYLPLRLFFVAQGKEVMPVACALMIISILRAGYREFFEIYAPQKEKMKRGGESK